MTFAIVRAGEDTYLRMLDGRWCRMPQGITFIEVQGATPSTSGEDYPEVDPGEAARLEMLLQRKRIEAGVG